MAPAEPMGAEVAAISSYRVEPRRSQELDTLVRDIATRNFDAVTFTSAPAAVAVLETGRHLSMLDVVVDAFHTDVAAVCVGPITAGPLSRLGVPTVQPGRMRLGAMVHALTEHLTHRPLRRQLALGPRSLEIGAGQVLLDGAPVRLSPAPMAVLRALAARPGEVLTRGELVRHLPGAGDDHAVEMAVARVRAVLGRDAVQTVVKRGYRLAGRC